tara:strand:- start:76 stop:666 length:591 start_codon:yes stop_codon:yes gene_type:complete
MKGFHVYRKLDMLLNSPEWKDKIEFTYIGNLPKGFNFKNSKHILPINGKELGMELSKHHIYLSASINEPAGMHHIEGILCGLPIIFRNSGALPEYCKNYGISFEDEDFIPGLDYMIKNYKKYKSNIHSYPNNSDKMTKEYLNLFSELLQNRNKILKKRFLMKSPIILISNFIFLFLKFKNVVKFINNQFRNKKNND